MDLESSRPPFARRAVRSGARAASTRMVSFFLVLLSAPALAQGTGPATHAEFDLSHRERVASVESTISDANPGQDDAASISITGNVVGTYGDQDVRVEAGVLSTVGGTVLLRTEGEHVFDLTGISIATDVWLEADSTMLARAELGEELTLSGVPGTAATLELYFQIRGMTDAMVDIDPDGDLFRTLATQIRLEATTAAPHSGGGTHATSIVYSGGYQASDFDEQKFLDEYVMLSLSVDPTQPIPLTILFEIDVTTNLRNIVEIGTLNAVGLHRPSFWDNGAELLGVVIKDDLGNALPNATVSASSGYDYPVTEDPPAPHPPLNLIVSPVAIIDSDLGEVSPSQSPFENMINQTGLSVPFTSGQTGFDVHFSGPNAKSSAGHFSGNWQSAVSSTLPLQGYIDFDLGSSYTIDRMALWNLSLQDLRVLVADAPTGPFTEVGQYTLSSHLNFLSYNVDFLDFDMPHVARYVRIQVDSAHLIDPSFTYAIIGEVALRAIPVPEPGSLLLAGWGIGGLVLLGHARGRAIRRDPHAKRVAGDPGRR